MWQLSETRYGTVAFNIPLDTLQVISETIFPTNHLTSAKTTFKLNKNSQLR